MVCDYGWLSENVLAMPIDYGGTWVSEDQPFMKYLVKSYGLTLFPQYSEGKYVYGLNETTYLRLDSLG